MLKVMLKEKPTIRLLPQGLINRIAAGEVIERPASVVKELVENALDSGATEIDIDIAGGGKSLIVVRDNGCGMTAEDLQMAVTRHATSKLPDDDLLHINSLGFRGEALPSIASVSKLSIISGRRDSADAWEISIHGGIEQTITPAPYYAGTMVEVADLFYATPARLKFLKSDRSENASIIEVFEKLALAREDVAFRISIDGKPKISLRAHNHADARASRARDLLGADFADNCTEISYIRDDITITGLAGLPTFHKHTAGSQYCFINRRPVRDKLLQGAIRAAYTDFLAHDRHPALCLYITMDPEMVDVNVHPAKTEVRFRDTDRMRGGIISAIRNAISTSGFRASSTVANATINSFTSNYKLQPLQTQNNNRPHNLSSAIPSAYQFNLMQPAGRKFEGAEPMTQPSARVENIADYEQPPRSYPLGAARAQVHGTYIVSQTDEGIVIVDQHAAHERLVYEQIKKNLASTTTRSQPLLIPVVVELGQVRQSRVLEVAAKLSEFGLVLEEFGDGAVIVREIPAGLKEIDVVEAVKAIAEKAVDFSSTTDLEEKLSHIAATFACHTSVRAGRKLSADEMNALLRAMENTPHSGQCNHGRPTYVELKLNDIERLFGRK